MSGAPTKNIYQESQEQTDPKDDFYRNRIKIITNLLA